MKDVSALNASLELFHERVVDTDYPSLFAFTNEVDLPEMKLDVLRLKTTEFRSPETCVG